MTINDHTGEPARLRGPQCSEGGPPVGVQEGAFWAAQNELRSVARFRFLHLGGRAGWTLELARLRLFVEA